MATPRSRSGRTSRERTGTAPSRAGGAGGVGTSGVVMPQGTVKGMVITYEVRVPPGSDEMNALRAAAWGQAGAVDWTPVLSRSLTFVTARDAAGALVGFVNVAWDGGVHAFLLDTTVHPRAQRRGTARALVRHAADDARALGAHWLHVDYEPHLQAFYAACGFRDTRAGLLNLTAPQPH